MTHERPDPDALLERVRAEEIEGRAGARSRSSSAMRRGSARRTRCSKRHDGPLAAGRDVVVGYVEPHGRPETEALLEGLEASCHARSMPYKGVTLREFDVDAALARRPELILVDELAHTNAEGCRHAKRWQDVEELLEAGINVWTTLNVQHIDSLNDVIGADHRGHRAGDRARSHLRAWPTTWSWWT